jgi:hypothetical protein
MEHKLHADDRAQLDRIVTLLDDPEIGIRRAVQRHGEAIYGNGRMGLNTKVLLLCIAVTMLAILVGADHPLVIKMIKAL